MLKKPVSGVLGREASYWKYAPAVSLPRALLTGFFSILFLSVILPAHGNSAIATFDRSRREGLIISALHFLGCIA
jgi:hypothetical protein